LANRFTRFKEKELRIPLTPIKTTLIQISDDLEKGVLDDLKDIPDEAILEFAS